MRVNVTMYKYYREGESYPEVDATFVEPDLPVFQPNDAPIVTIYYILVYVCFV